MRCVRCSTKPPKCATAGVQTSVEGEDDEPPLLIARASMAHTLQRHYFFIDDYI